MKKINYILAPIGIMLFPLISSAYTAGSFGGSSAAFVTLLANILTFVNNIIIPFIIGIGFLVFVWGMFQFFIAGGSNDEAKEKGKSLMIYATLGFVLIIVFWGIVNLLTSSTGLDNGNTNINPGTITI